MIASSILTTLKNMGYKIMLDGENVKLAWQGNGEPDKAKIQPLVEYLKTHKRETIACLSQATSPIPFETLHGIFEDALQDLGKHGDRGLFYFGEKDPELIKKERETLAHVDSLWKECQEGKATLFTFKGTVRNWYDVMVKLYSPLNN